MRVGGACVIPLLPFIFILTHSHTPHTHTLSLSLSPWRFTLCLPFRTCCASPNPSLPSTTRTCSSTSLLSVANPSVARADSRRFLLRRRSVIPPSKLFSTLTAPPATTARVAPIPYRRSRLFFCFQFFRSRGSDGRTVEENVLSRIR